jgi:hypothetical protein
VAKKLGEGSLFDPVRVRLTIKSVSRNLETGEGTMIVKYPKSESGRVAQLSLYDGIAFDAVFTPVEAATLGKESTL